MLPLARKDKLTIRELREETLVYDLERHLMHCLNRTAALVWKHCDGRHSVTGLAALVGFEFHLARDEAVAATRLALEQLSRRHLLGQPIVPLLEKDRLSRRQVLRKIAVAAAVALPVVMSLKSPSFARGQGGATSCAEVKCPTGETCVVTPKSGNHDSSGGNAICVPNATLSVAECGGQNAACGGKGQAACCAGCDCLGGFCSC